MATLTAANAVIMFSVTGLISTPQQLQGFAADDVLDTDPIDSAEVLMGVDGTLSAGFVFVPIQQNYHLQADSPSISLFDQWWSAQQQVQDVFFGAATIRLPSLGKKWNMVRGVLSQYKPIPDGRRILQPQAFRVTWNSMIPQPA